MVEDLFDPCKGLPTDHELFAGPGGHLEADLDGIVAKLLDTLQLQRLDDVLAESRIFGQLLSNLFDELAGFLKIGDPERGQRHEAGEREREARRLALGPMSTMASRARSTSISGDASSTLRIFGGTRPSRMAIWRKV